jgi:hypothetical protein
VRVGADLLDLARSVKAHSLFVVGTGREVGKTTVVRAVYAAARDYRMSTALASLNPRHRLWLTPQTLFVTARGVLVRTPAAEILELSRLRTPNGALLYARTRRAGWYELVGPSTASGVREVVDALAARSDMVILDGAVDRVAALAGSRAAIVVACGAAAAKTRQEALDDVVALVARLRVPRFDANSPAIQLDGALTSATAASLFARRETRQIVVGDPTQIALSGKAVTHALERLKIRCHRPLRVIATTVASVAAERSFEPRDFINAVAAATGLPAFDVYAGTRAA